MNFLHEQLAGCKMSLMFGAVLVEGNWTSAGLTWTLIAVDTKCPALIAQNRQLRGFHRKQLIVMVDQGSSAQS
jgi:hypothetical protein